jgi:AraC-like DNA-binding protein
VAYRLGFNSSSHFSTAFRRKFGIRPSDVRRKSTAETERPVGSS